MKIIFSLLNFEFTKGDAQSPPSTQNNYPPGSYYSEPVKREEVSVPTRSEMPSTSKENAQTKTSESQKQKTSWKKVVLAIVLTIIAIIAAFSANTPLVNEVLSKLIENL